MVGLARAGLSISLTTLDGCGGNSRLLSPRYDEDPCPRMQEVVVKWHRDKSWVVDGGYKMK